MKRPDLISAGPLQKLLWGGLAVLLLSSATVGAAGQVPSALMVKIVMAAVAYDRSIDERFGDVVEVAVAGDSSRATELMAVLGKYSGKKLKGKDIQLTNVSVADIGTAKLDIVFFADSLGADAGTVAALCQQNQITAISADEDGVASGLALGVELTSDGKPKLLINLDAAKSAGANFSAQILKLARLVDGK